MNRRHVLLPLLALLAPSAVGVAAAGPAHAEATCDGRVPTIVAVAGVATTGTPGDDVILGTDARDAIDGGSGDDTICGLGGGDRLVGGPGDDRLFGGLDDEYYPDDGYLGDVLVPGPGNDHVDLGDDPASADVDYVDRLADYDTVSYADAPGPVVVDLSAGTATGEGTDTIAVPQYSGGVVGSAHDDVLVGTPGPDRIRGGGGLDRITAGAGDDDVEAGGGSDVVHAGDGDDIVLGRTGRDRIHGDAGEDFVEAHGPGSSIGGGDGDDYLVGHVGVSVHGGAGRDEIGAVLIRRQRIEVDGGPGLDVVRLRAPRSQLPRGTRVVVDVPRRRVTADARTRAVYERVERLAFTGPGGPLTYLGGPRPDHLSVNGATRVTAYGRGGRDVLVGGRLADRLDGGAGRDDLVGGDGRDRCTHGERLRQCEVRR